MTNKKIYGLLGISSKAGKNISGADTCILAMEKKAIKLLIVAEDASEKTKKNLRYYSEKYDVEMIEYGNIEELSKSIGKKNKAIIGIKDENFAKAIKKIINGGEVIG